MQDVAQPVDSGTLDGVGLEKVVLLKFYAAGAEGGRIFFGPDAMFGLL